MSQYTTNQDRAAALFRLAATLKGTAYEEASLLASQLEDGESLDMESFSNLAEAKANLRVLVGFVDQIAARDPRAHAWADEARRQYIDVLAEQAKEESAATQTNNATDDSDPEVADDDETANHFAGHLADA